MTDALETFGGAPASDQGLILERPRDLKINGLPAHRAETLMDSSAGSIEAQITWIAFDGMVYRLVAGREPGTTARYQVQFRRFAHSFRPLTEHDRASIEELRLRTVRALEGETLAQLSARSDNAWDPLYTAVVNGLFIDERLLAGQRIKVAIPTSYRPEPETSMTEEPPSAAVPGAEP